MKVLHLSEFGLPDWRIEKSAISAKRKGYDVFFAGEKNVHEYRNITFNKIYEFNWNIKAKYQLPLYYQTLKKKISNIIKEIRPDIIHALIFFQQNSLLNLIFLLSSMIMNIHLIIVRLFTKHSR